MSRTSSEATLSLLGLLCYMRCIQYLDRVLACHHADLAAFVPWHVGGVGVGHVHNERVTWLLSHRSPFARIDGRLCLLGEDFASRSAGLATIVLRLVAAGELRLPQGEAYPVCGRASAQPLLQIDRTAVPWFGVRAFGVHLSAYVRTSAGLALWLAERSHDKRTFPGHLDNMVAGGQSIGLTPLAALVKECAEEAGLDSDTAARAVPVGTVTYVQQDGLSLKPDTLACFDLELPASCIPRPIDGEVERFLLWSPAQVAASLCSDLGSNLRSDARWKPNSAMVALDFLLRFGCLDGELTAAHRWRLWQAIRGA